MGRYAIFRDSPAAMVSSCEVYLGMDAEVVLSWRSFHPDQVGLVNLTGFELTLYQPGRTLVAGQYEDASGGSIYAVGRS